MKKKKTLAWKIRYCVSRTIASCLPDKLYLSIKFRTRFGYWMDWKHPKTYSEKLQWMKVFDRHEEFTQMVDKAAAKEYVSKIIGKEFIIPTLAVYKSAEEIDFDKLPSQFVLKCTHDSGGLVICKDKSKLNIDDARKKLRKGLKRTYVVQNREYPYAKVPRQIIAEPYLEDESGFELKDYKIFCFDGIPHHIEVDYGRYIDHKRNIYDTNWNFLEFQNNIKYPFDINHVIAKPQNLELMLSLAKKLSAGLKHVRVDLYNINGKIYFGELTFFHGTGMARFKPKEWDLKLGNLIHLPTDDQ